MSALEVATTRVVFDVESNPLRPFPLGAYIATDEDVVIYTSPTGGTKHAPADCVSVVNVQVP